MGIKMWPSLIVRVTNPIPPIPPAAVKVTSWETESLESYLVIFSSDWGAQTFIPPTAHQLTRVYLRGYRTLTPGLVTVSIRAVDGANKPTGADLSVGYFDSSALPTALPSAWFQVPMSAFTMAAGAKYAIVVRAPDGDVFNVLSVKTSYPPDDYTDGETWYSGDSGATWDVTSPDMLFQDWGLV